MILIIVGCSLLLQLVAAIIAIRQIRLTGTFIGWLFIALAILLMGFRRGITFLGYVSGNPVMPLDVLEELAALGISALMVVGVFSIGAIFQEVRRSHEQLNKEISHRKESEQATKKSEERYRQLVDLLPDGVLVDVQGRFVFANKAAAAIMGMASPEECVGTPVLDVIHSEYRPVVEDRIRKVLAKREVAPLIEERIVRTDGAVVDVEAAAAPIDYQGQKAALVVVRDIGDRKKAERELLSSARRFQYLLSASPSVIYTCKAVADYEATFISDNVRIQLGYEPSDFVKESSFWVDHIHPEDAPRILTGLAVLFERGYHVHEYRFLHKDGSYCWMRDEMNLIRDEKGDPCEIIGSWIDITERKQAEEHIKESLREKEVLLREIHHRVKNNLQVMSSLLRIQSRYVKDQSVIEALRDSENRIRAMALVHENLYNSENLEKIEADKLVRNVVHSLFGTCGAASSGKRLNIEVQNVSFGIETAIPLGLIVSELVSNALTHAFPEGKEGDIGIALSVVEDDTFELIVSDNGVGLPEDVDITHPRSMGFDLVLRLTKQLHANIEVNRGEGTQFRIKFKSKKSGANV